MKSRKISVCALVGCLGATFISGCEDSAAKQRDAVQASLNEIKRDLQVAMASAGVGEDASAGVTRLNQVITQLQGVTGGEAGQQASKSLLAATALRELADIHAMEIQAIEARHRDARNQIRTQFDAALRMNAIATGLLKVDAKADRDSLQRELQTAKTTANELSQKFMQLGEPITRQTSQNDAQLKEVERLRVEVGNLLRRAQELGHADGFETYKQAATIGRQADEIELKVAHSEIELDYQLNPEHKSVATQVNQLQGMIEAIEKAQANLDAFAAASSTDIEATRIEINRIVSQINESLDAVNKERTGPLADQYSQAMETLEKAAAQADAATKADAHTAKLISVRAHEALGRLHASQARALADHKSTLELLVNGSKELGVDGKYAQQLGEASVAYDQALQSAKEQYATAAEQLGSVQSRGDQETVARYQQKLDGMIAALEGNATASPAPDPTPSSDSSPETSTGTDADLGPGFESPEALVEFIKSLEQSDKSVAELQNDVHSATIFQTAQGKKVKQFTLELVPAFGTLFDALVEKFGRETTMAAFKSSGMELFPDLSTATIKAIDDSHASITFQRANGQPKTEHMVKVNERWYFDGDKLDMEDQQLLASIGPIAPLMKDACQKITQQVQADAYKSPDEALQAMQQSVMSGAMEQAMKAGQGGKPRSN
jgi:hypothetical protein